jgi:UDP-N-acetylmuramate--alanine ligase
VLLEEGYKVSGSDMKLSPITDGLVRLGATVYEGHSRENVRGANLVLVSSAIPSDNPEVLAARDFGIPVVKRDWFLGRMMEGRYGIAVAGSHGKTTISAMLSLILMDAGYDPTFIVGGILENLGTNAKSGAGDFFVIEADEYDRTFLGLRPDIAVVTNIEMDHPDCYPRIEDMLDAFQEFIRLVKGCVIGCGDEIRVREVLGRVERAEVITYGLGEDVDWRAVEIRDREGGGKYFVALRGGERVGEFGLRVPGLHNVINALAAIVVADRLGLDLMAVRESLRRFGGVKRRFELKGISKGVTVIDDYAHHPTQLKTTLKTARERYPGKEIWAVFQPHTYSRTKALLREFAKSFADADHVIVTEVYAAREFDTLGVSGSDIVALMEHPDARFIAELDEVVGYLLSHLKPGDLLLTLGAGDGYKVGEEVLAELEGRG